MDFQYSFEVLQAKELGLPIVALESTIISHGMPYPDNLKTAQEVEDIVRANNAIPATIAILFGKVHIGLSFEELSVIAQAGENCIKCSRRNLPQVVLKKAHGSTTVAATMYLAALAGLKIFVTGGIGGVHRGAEETWDVSADLIELGRTPITVVCAGAKSILDIGKTLEYLETQGVPVIGFQTNKFPAFYSASSGFEVMCRLENTNECAEFIKQGEKLGLTNGNLIAVPLNEENLAKNAENAIQIALEESKEKGIKGAQVTPFLLKRVNELSEGESLKANILLIKQNAKIGSMIACDYYKNKTNEITIIGELLFQSSCFYNRQIKENIKGKIVNKVEGTGFNILNYCEKNGAECNFVSIVGNDIIGTGLLNETKKICNGQWLVFQRNQSSSSLLNFAFENEEEKKVFDRKDIEFDQEEFRKIEKVIERSKIVVVDGFVSANSLRITSNLCENYGKTMVLYLNHEENCSKVIESGILSTATILLTHINELSVILNSKTDSSIMLINKFIEAYPKVILILNNDNQGIWLIQNNTKHKFDRIPNTIAFNLTDHIFAGELAIGLLNHEELSKIIHKAILI